MPFTQTPITLEKRNGEIVTGYTGLVQPNKIFVKEEAFPVEVGDVITVSRPNGILQRNRVLDTGYRPNAVMSSYQIKVCDDASPQSQPSQTTTYNLHGANSRVNQNSVDNSVNNVTTTPESVFDELRRAIEQNVNLDDGRIALCQEVTTLELAHGSADFLPRYKDFMQVAANHMTVVAPFVPALTHWLTTSL